MRPIPLPLTVLEILTIDLGTEIVPALALGREPAEPGLMSRPPRPRGEGVIQSAMLMRAWILLGLISAGLAMGCFFYVLTRAGWHPGDPTGTGSPPHHAYLQATTMTLLAIVVCQVGTAFAARTERASLRPVGPLTNQLLLWGIAFELGLAAALMYLPPLRAVFASAPVPAVDLVLLAPLPFIVWGVDETYRAVRRRVSRPQR